MIDKSFTSSSRWAVMFAALLWVAQGCRRAPHHRVACLPTARSKSYGLLDYCGTLDVHGLLCYDGALFLFGLLAYDGALSLPGLLCAADTLRDDGFLSLHGGDTLGWC